MVISSYLMVKLFYEIIIMMKKQWTKDIYEKLKSKYLKTPCAKP
jgi:hypothetical protein